MVRTGQPEVDRALQELFRLLTAAGSKITNGALLTSIAVGTTAKPIAHKLGRRLNGYIVVGSTVATSFADDNAGKPDLDRFLYIKAAAPTTISLWIF